MRLSKALFVLPTLFTLTSVFLGLLSLVSAAEGNFRLSALTILFAIVFDSIDGGVARLTRTQSKFGVQIDSLADVVSFGVAPAVLVYLSLLQGKLVAGPFDLGLLAAFVYLGAGAIRLARYNVDSDRKKGPVTRFMGLPIPGGAGIVAGMVLGLVKEGRELGAMVAALFLVLLAFLMVSRVRYRKKMQFRHVDAVLLLSMLIATITVTAFVRPAFAVFAGFAFYVCSGLVETTLSGLFRLGRRMNGHRRARANERSSRKLR